jgi:hypothetical protein
MNMLGEKEGSDRSRGKLTRLQKDGIAAKLENNPVVQLMSIGLRGVSIGEATLTFMRLFFEPRTASALVFLRRHSLPVPSTFPDCELEVDRHQQPEPISTSLNFRVNCQIHH